MLNAKLVTLLASAITLTSVPAFAHDSGRDQSKAESRDSTAHDEREAREVDDKGRRGRDATETRQNRRGRDATNTRQKRHRRGRDD